MPQQHDMRESQTLRPRADVAARLTGAQRAAAPIPTLSSSSTVTSRPPASTITFAKVLPDSVDSLGDPDGGPIASGETRFGQINTPSDFDGFQFSGHPGVRVVIIAANKYTSLEQGGIRWRRGTRR